MSSKIVRSAAVAGVLLCAMFIVSLWLAYPSFESKRYDDYFALINSLPILFYLSIVSFSVICLIMIFFVKGNYCLLLLMPLVLSFMLWMTPYLLTNFVRLPMGPWKIGQSIHIEEILKGAQVPLSWYARDYPSSFVSHDIMILVAGFDPLYYINRAYPVILEVLIVVFVYTLICRIFDKRSAILSVLLAIPGMHYVVLQPGPSSYGLLLFMASLIFLTIDNKMASVIALVSGCVLVISHPVYSTLLFAFLFGSLFVKYLRKDSIIHISVKWFGFFALVFFIWELWFVAPGRSVLARLASFAPSNFLTAFFGSGPPATHENLVFAQIDLLQKIVYATYLISAMICLTLFLRRRYGLGMSSAFHFRTIARALTSSQICVIVNILISLLAGGYFLLRTPDEAERPLFLFVVFCSSIVGSTVSSFANLPHAPASKAENQGTRGKRITKIAAAFLIILTSALVFIYPFISYSVDSYSNFPLAEEMGLKFLSEESINKSILILLAADQLLLYKEHFTLVPNDKWVYAESSIEVQEAISRILSSADIVAMRRTGFFYAAIKLDRSFESNRFIATQQALQDNLSDIVYSNPSFNIWVRTRGG